MYVDIPQAPLDKFRGQQISDAGDSDLGVVDRRGRMPDLRARLEPLCYSCSMSLLHNDTPRNKCVF